MTIAIFGRFQFLVSSPSWSDMPGGTHGHSVNVAGLSFQEKINGSSPLLPKSQESESERLREFFFSWNGLLFLILVLI